MGDTNDSNSSRDQRRLHGLHKLETSEYPHIVFAMSPTVPGTQYVSTCSWKHRPMIIQKSITTALSLAVCCIVTSVIMAFASILGCACQYHLAANKKNYKARQHCLAHVLHMLQRRLICSHNSESHVPFAS